MKGLGTGRGNIGVSRASEYALSLLIPNRKAGAVPTHARRISLWVIGGVL